MREKKITVWYPDNYENIIAYIESRSNVYFSSPDNPFSKKRNLQECISQIISLVTGSIEDADKIGLKKLILQSFTRMREVEESTITLIRNHGVASSFRFLALHELSYIEKHRNRKLIVNVIPKEPEELRNKHQDFASKIAIECMKEIGELNLQKEVEEGNYLKQIINARNKIGKENQEERGIFLSKMNEQYSRIYSESTSSSNDNKENETPKRITWAEKVSDKGDEHKKME